MPADTFARFGLGAGGVTHLRVQACQKVMRLGQSRLQADGRLEVLAGRIRASQTHVEAPEKVARLGEIGVALDGQFRPAQRFMEVLL